MKVKKSQHNKEGPRTGWDPVAAWYDGWMGKDGSQHHQHLAIPALLSLLDMQPGERLLDIGAGQGVLAPYVMEMGVSYTGVDASKKLLKRARRRHRHGRFLAGDARVLCNVKSLSAGMFDTAVFLLSVQDMDPLPQVLASAAWALKPDGRLVILMTHPCFRVPRQSGWGWDKRRKLRYRRIDRYLTALPVPMKAYHGRRPGTTRSFHRPLQTYINELSACGFMIDQVCEIPPGEVMAKNGRHKADKIASQEIPLFLGIRAVKVKDER